jgi:hypothetical protein
MSGQIEADIFQVVEHGVNRAAEHERLVPGSSSQGLQHVGDRQQAWLKRGHDEQGAKMNWRPRKLHRVAARGVVLRLDNAVFNM